MAQIATHSGNCCGVRHIYSMDNSTVRQLEEQIATVDAIPRNGGSETSGRLIEIILSSRQVGERNPRGETGNRWAPCVAAEGGWPAVMQRLGFRLVSRFENKNSGADCYIFHRVPRFKSIRPVDLPFAWDHGSYQRQAALDEGGQGDRVAAAGNLWPIGTRVRYAMNGAAESKRGCYGRIVGQAEALGRYLINWEDPHVQAQNGGPYTATYFERVAEAPVAAPVVVVATFYANVLQTGIGAFFPTVEAARAAAPRCRQQARIEVLSNGERTTTNL